MLFVRASLVVAFCLMAFAGQANAQLASETRPSCDLGQCINICQADKLQGDDCPSLCSKIISLCTRIVLEQERTRFVRRKPIAW